MKQWEIILYPFEVERSHPAVIISTGERCANPDLSSVNALICTSVRLSREPKVNEVILDEADGLDWKTAVRCDVVYLLAKTNFKELRGRVSRPRRSQLTRKIISALQLPTF